MVGFTTRLVDNNVFQNDFLAADISIGDVEPARLVFHGGSIENIKHTIAPNPAVKIRKIKSGILREMTPGILNGFLIVTMIVIVYAFLYYRYHKKKENLPQQ
jgi:hypothetical protein